MRQANLQDEAHLTKLQATYQAAWRRFSVEVRRWQSLQVQVPGNAISIREAKTAANLMEEQYRQARNALAECMLKHSCSERLSIPDQLCHQRRLSRLVQVTCFEHA
jgi:hypothetical protein